MELGGGGEEVVGGEVVVGAGGEEVGREVVVGAGGEGVGGEKELLAVIA